MKAKFPLAAGIILIPAFLFSQSYIGYAVDNYSGVHGIIINPASVVDSNFRTDINLASVSAFLGSDYFGIDVNYALKGNDGFSFDENLQRFPKDDNQFFVNVDVLGPSFMFNLNKMSSLGVTTRMRGFMNLNNLNGRLYESLEDGFNDDENYDFELKDFSATIHTWSEIGLTYGRIIMQGSENFLKGGVTLKYLQGEGATFAQSPAASGEYRAEAGTLVTTGNLSFGETEDFDRGNVDFQNLSSGFGADVGLTYEFRPNAVLSDDPDEVPHSDYKFKVGLSVTDIGSIKYSKTKVTSYDLNNSVSKERFDQMDLEQVLDEDYEGTDEVMDLKVGLPTAVHLLVDYKFRKHLLLAVHSSLSLVGEGAGDVNRVLNTVTAVPRFESKWFSFYLPVGMRQYDGFTMGAGLRFGPLSVGSGSLISNYITDSAKTTDVYFGLKVPIYR